jgi:hypothetical protein
MGGVEVVRDMTQGFGVVRLRNAEVEVGIMPDLGAKIMSLRNRRSGREWMWTPPHGARYRRVSAGTPFDQSSLVGADECLPTIAPCLWRGRQLPDHGEVWSEAWRLDEAALAVGRTTTRLQLPVSPFTLERTVSLDGATVSLEYLLQNTSPAREEFMWAFHPLIAIEAGDELALAGDGIQVRTEASMNCPLGQRGAGWSWPEPLPGIQFDRLDLGGEARAVKLFTEPGQVGGAEVRNARTSNSLRFVFDPQQIDTLGLWINRGGWNGFHHLAIEPGIGAPDPLAAAVQDWRRFGKVEAGAERKWGFQIIVGN